MVTPPCLDPKVGVSSIVSPNETKMTKNAPISTQPQMSNANESSGKMVSISPVRNIGTIQSTRLSSERAPPLPYTGGFRLQPRKNISYLTSHSPRTPNSLTPSRGRKRGAYEASTIGPKTLPRQHSEGNEVDSPILMHHAMQSMSIQSPTLSTPSLQDNTVRDKELPSPFFVFSPSLKQSPNKGHLRSESLYSMESSTKPPSSVVTAPSTIAPIFGSPSRREARGSSVNSEVPSTPRSHTATSCQDPSTPGSIRTLPSPHTTPLPRSFKLTPRSRRQRGGLSNESSIFLSPNENLDKSSTGKEGTTIFSFEGELGYLEDSRRRVEMRASPYVASPFSCSRTSTKSRSGQAVSSIVEEVGGGKLRVETRSLLGEQDSTSTLDHIIASNARIAAQNCDDSLSDDSNEPFVLTNPATLAQEREATIMSPPRPSQRRRMSPEADSVSFDASTNVTNGDFSSDTIHTSDVGVHHHGNDFTSNHEDKKKNLSIDLSHLQSGNIFKSTTNSRFVQKYSSRLEPIESCCSLVGLGLMESSSSIIDSNLAPTTPPAVFDVSIDSTPPGTPSKSSVCISRSDADDVHLTIANMAVLHQEQSPTLTACSG